MTDKVFERVEVVCLGTRVLNGTTKCTAVKLYGSGFTEQSHFGYMKSLGVNNIYTIECVVENGVIKSCRPETAMYKESRPDAGNRLLHQSAETLLAAIAQEKKGRNDDSDVLNCLRPLRVKYNATNAMGKLALEVRVLNYLRSDKGLL